MNRRGRPADPNRRAEILAAATEHLLDHGLSDLALRPLAAAIGGSPQLLMHHFGTKEQLLTEVIAHVDELRRQSYIEALADGEAPQDIAWRGWQATTSERSLAFERFRMHILALALDEPERYREFLRTFNEDTIDLIEAGLEVDGVADEDRTAVATVVRAVLRGLLLDLLASGDRDRVEAAAFHYFGDQLRRWMDEMRAEGRLADSTARRPRITGSKPPATRHGDGGQ